MEFRNELTIHPSLPNYFVWLPLDPSGRILLQRKDERYPRWPNCWCTFGGKMEMGERGAETLLREGYEEFGKRIGLIGSPIFFVSQTFDEGEGEQSRKVNVNYFAIRFDGNLSRISLGEGVGFSVFNEEEISRYHQFGLVVTPNYQVIKKLYQSLKNGTFKF